ncbi:FAD linked oxidase domain protein [Cellulomonas flavigena DSM 20109]|uniref:FAD linked oxidase domain protein n=1 Tax=Cellulomonas flavigena (strain ATCC 482 / DSM 20109 / BCRC 11376 / JCM 18109 / NBRC 3775 / NCIMB 8073 / NRS 134) TaxID=446466 RepID=D5UDP3_CELFN|nr:FAD-binding oxidoreductase [Cellulomonas flavigena]ADG76499.1 FAD linked oxidase domain protein [Cellulomonas flavigena DSM 20109]
MTDFDDLRRAVRGTLRMPGDAGFAERTRPFNERFRDSLPNAVLTPVSVQDVSAAVTWAGRHGVPVVPRGGGHSYAGHSSSPGLVLDLTHLDRVDVDPRTGLVIVGGGTRMGVLSAALREHDLALPLGNSDDVGIGGLVLGGGVSVVSRAMGLTCDTLVSTDVVLADGRTVTCDDDDHADLFWACRGGGGGNFGVNTSFTFQAQATRPTSTCILLWEGRHAFDVLATMQEVMERAPDEFSARTGVSRAPGAEAVVSVVGQHLGPPEELRELLAPAVAIGPPTRLDIADTTFWDAAALLRHTTAGGAYAVRTRTTPTSIGADGLKTLVTAVDDWPGGTNPDGAGVALFAWGGAINQVPADATAFPHRDVRFLVAMDTSWGRTDPPESVRDNLAWLHHLHRDMGDHARDAAYVNFTDPDLTDWRTGYYGPNSDRLAEVKRRYDPRRVFSFAQAV